MKRAILALLLCVCMTASLILLLPSCGKQDEEKQTDPVKVTDETRPDEQGTREAETAPVITHWEAKVPDSVDLSGKTLTIMTYANANEVWYDVDFDIATYTGDEINDAAFNRLNYAEEKTKVDIVAVKGEGYGQESMKKEVVSGGSNHYDCGMVFARGACTLAEEDYLVDLNEYGSLELDQPWWDQDARNDLSVNHKSYMIAGDISIMYRKSLRVLYFNKEVMEEMTDVTSPYVLVDNGNWTIAKLSDIARAASKDLDGDGEYKPALDRFGILGTVDTFTTMMVGANVRSVVKDEDDLPVPSYYSAETVDIFDQICDLMYDKTAAVHANVEGIDVVTQFMNNQGLFASIELHNLVKLRQMTTNFGILPNPKADEFQDRYWSTINAHVAAMLVIPTTSMDEEKTSIVLDVLAAESKNVLTPAYYERFLQGKAARDEESQESLDIIFHNVAFDLGVIYNWGGIGVLTQNMSKQYNSNLTSEYEKIGDTFERELEKTIDSYLSR